MKTKFFILSCVLYSATRRGGSAIFFGGLVSCFLILAVPLSSEAAIPKLITYQGLLKDASSNYLTGTYSMIFRIYEASTGGASVWNETQSSVSVSSGRFSVQLGSVSTLNLPFDRDHWLSIQVGTDSEMSPRQKLTSVGYAYRAEYVVQGFTQGQHDELSHMNIKGVKSAHANIAKTNFKLDAYSSASANNMGDMLVDVFTDSSGIASSLSSGYTWRASPNFDVIVTPNTTSTKLLLHMNGTDGSTTFTDSGTSAHSVTAMNGAQIDTAQSKFGGASGLFDGTNDWLSLPDHADWYLATGDFTIDFWVRFNAAGSIYSFLNQRIDGNDNWRFIWFSNTLRFAVDSATLPTITVDGPWTPSIGTWYHVACTRSGNDFRLFVNGSQVGTTTTDSDPVPDFAASLQIGVTDTSFPLNGWLDELRIVKGVAVWTSNFTPPSQEHTNDVPSPNPATVVSAAFSESQAPKEAMVIGSETLNGGSITYYVSRDNGTTWTECANESVVSLTTQPSGTQVRWKAVISGSAELDSIAVSLA